MDRTMLAVAAMALLAHSAAAQDGARPDLVVQLAPGNVRCVAFSPDGSLVLTGASDARLWDATSGRLVRCFRNHTQPVTSAAFSPDGRHILTGSLDRTARLWEAASGDEIRRFDAAERGVYAVAFSPDGRHVLAACDFGALLWDVTGREILQLKGHSGSVVSMAFSPDGSLILTGSTDQTARLWDARSGSEIRRFTGHLGEVSASFSPDGRQVLTASYDVRLWDTGSGKELLHVEGDGQPVNAAAFSPDGRFVLTGGDVVRREDPEAAPRTPAETRAELASRLRDASSGNELRRFEGHDGPVRCVAFSPDGRYVLTGSDDTTARLWETSSGRELRRFEGRVEYVTSVALSPDSGHVLTCASLDKTARLWDVRAGKPVRRFEGHADMVQSATFSPDGRHAVTASLDKTARLWDVESGREIGRFEHPAMVLSVAFSPDGRTVMTGSWDQTARLWDVSSGAEVRRFEGHKGEVVSVAVSPSGRHVLTGGDGARLWDADSGTEIRRFEHEGGHIRSHAETMYAVAFSPDGRQVVTAGRDQAARLWDAESGQEIRAFMHSNTVTAVAFSSDGSVLRTGSLDLTMRTWNAASGQELLRSGGHRISSMACSPDGRFVASGGADGTTRLWNGATGEEICALVSFLDGTWAVVAPDGRFDCTDLERIDGLHWVMPDDPMTPVPIEIFMRDYYEPRLLPRLLAGEQLPPMPPLFGKNRVQPRVRVASVETEADTATVAVEVEETERTYGGKTRRSGAQDLQLFRDGRLVAHRDGPLATGKVVFKGIALPRDGRKEVEFSAYAFNADRVKSETHRKKLALPPLEPRRGTAYVIALGIDAFADPKWNLSYAVADAHAIVEALRGRLSGYERVVPVLLTDARATKAGLANVLRLLAGRDGAPVPEPLEPARPEDLVLLSLSTHGHTDDKGRFHILPSDVAKGEGFLASCISADELTDWLRDVDAGEMAMIVDACHSAASVDAEGFKPGPMGSRGLGQLAYSKRMRVLAASQASDVALESRAVRHGLLTYALATDGLAKGRADFDPKDKRITLAEWLRYGERRVPSLAEEIAEGKVKGLDVERKRRVAQQPSLFDFARETDDVVLAAE